MGSRPRWPVGKPLLSAIEAEEVAKRSPILILIGDGAFAARGVVPSFDHRIPLNAVAREQTRLRLKWESGEV
jgi:hypothetical protein